jgi:hypothetical protein
MSFGGVLENDYASLTVVVFDEIEAAVKHYGLAIGTVQLHQRRAANDPAGIAGDGVDVLDDHIVGMEIKKVLPVDEAAEALLDDPEEGLEPLEIV